MKTTVTILVVCLLGGSGIGSHPARMGSVQDAHARRTNPTLQDTTMRAKIKAPGAGFRGMFSFHTGNHEYTQGQMSQYGVDFGLASGVQAVFNVGYWGFLAEFETGFDVTSSDAFGGSHTIELSSNQNSFWLRYRWCVFGTPFFLSPGASVGLTTAEVQIYDKSRLNSDGTVDSVAQLLHGSGTSYALGVMSEFGFVGGFGLVLDYRYQFVDYTEVKSLNGGEFFYPSDSQLNFSGHSFAIGASFYLTTAIGWPYR